MRRRKLFFGILMFFMVVPHVTFCFQGVSLAQSTAMKVKIGQKAPDLMLKTLDGDEVTLSDCKKEIPTLVKNYNTYKDKGFEILAITLQTGDDEEVREIVEKFNIPYPILMDERLKVATKIYGLSGPIPLKVIIGVDGVVKYAHVGDYPPGEDEVPFVVEDLIQEIPEQ
jgi:peroxiredoxin